MKIIVCVKQVPATNEVRMDPVTNTIIREGVESIINPFDTYALEEAIRLQERFGAEIATISMGIPSVSAVLRETVALGSSQACLLSDRAFAGADTLATAYALAKGIDKIGAFDLIICGKMATDGDTAQVGPMLAEELNIPHLTDISAIEEYADGYLICRKQTDDGYARVKVTLPALITVTKEINVPRLPSISGLLRGNDSEIPIYSVADVDADTSQTGLSGSPTQVVKTFVPTSTVSGEMLQGSNSEKAAALLQRLAAEKIVSE